MLIKIDNSKKVGNKNIQILYPGLSINETDSGFATFGRIDQANFLPGSLVAIHPHRLINGNMKQERVNIILHCK
ncbi:MAG: hypothetical protein M3015_06005 [Bacteroidota bacterium]|nr:hypothetical protein [Bacteroidota bacterium]